MQVPDLVNACFELFASIMILNNCRVLIKDQAVAGVSVVSTSFFTKVNKRTVSVSNGAVGLDLVDPSHLLPRDPFAELADIR